MEWECQEWCNNLKNINNLNNSGVFLSSSSFPSSTPSKSSLFISILLVKKSLSAFFIIPVSVVFGISSLNFFTFSISTFDSDFSGSSYSIFSSSCVDETFSSSSVASKSFNKSSQSSSSVGFITFFFDSFKYLFNSLLDSPAKMLNSSFSNFSFYFIVSFSL